MAEGKTIAILISNGDYPNWGPQAAEHDPTIKNAKASHSEFKKIISDLHYFGSEESPIQLIEFPDKESPEIRRGVQRVTQECKASDTLYLYYVGHGLKKTDGNLYLTTKDTEYDLVETSSISSSEIRKLLGNCQAGRKIVILDCCFAGYFLGGTQDADWNTQHIHEMQEMKGTFYMFSAPSGQRSKFKKNDETLATYFTLALTKAIKEGDPKAGDYFTALEILDLVEKNIDELREIEEDPDIPDPDKEIKKNAEKFPFCRNVQYVRRLSQEDTELNDIIANPTIEKVRAWQDNHSESPRFDETIDLLLVLENAETELNTLSSLPAAERAQALALFAKKHSKFKELRRMALDRFDKAKKEARASLDQVSPEKTPTINVGNVMNVSNEVPTSPAPREAK